MQSFVARGVLAASGDGERRKKKCDGDYGDIAPVASENTGETLLALPEGFKYNVFGRTGVIMSDGRPTPPAHDGMAAFETNDADDDDDRRDDDRRDHDRRGRDHRDHDRRKNRKRLITLVRNHEVSFSRPGVAIDPASAYDPLTGGGTTTLIVDAETRLPIRSFVSISGTHNNCAGGPTPWGSWITCEENIGGLARGFGKPHGYAFDVSAKSTGPVDAVPLKAMGRFVHEAIAVDPHTGIIYETEDQNPQCGFYRFIPHRRNKPAAQRGADRYGNTSHEATQEAFCHWSSNRRAPMSSMPLITSLSHRAAA